jgi:uncharacterized protein (AIM24 family)
VRHAVFGEIAQYARLDLDAGDSAWVSRGSLLAYSADVRWRLRAPGGIAGATRRTLAGEGIALTHLRAAAAGQYALIGANAPGRILEWELADGPVLATRGAFLAAWGAAVQIEVTVARRLGAAVFGGAGLFLQKVSGSGTVLLHARGDVRAFRLEENEKIIVSTGNLAAFGEGVDYDLQSVGGVRKVLFGREGFVMTKLTGPGRVVLQSLKRRSEPSRPR